MENFKMKGGDGGRKVRWRQTVDQAATQPLGKLLSSLLKGIKCEVGDQNKMK